MNEQDTARLLSYLTGLDPWLKTTSPDEAAMMLTGWADMLTDVPVGHALRTAKGHYSAPGARTLTPGDVLAAWRADEAHRESLVEQETRRVEAAREVTAAPIGVVQDGLYVGAGGVYLRALVEAVNRGTDLALVPKPAGLRHLRPEVDLRERRCVYHDLCACDHTRCRGGFLDEPAVTYTAGGRVCDAVRPCSFCYDALLMAQEKGRAKKPSRAGRR